VTATVRLAGDGDLAALAALRREWTAENGGVADDPEFESRFDQWWAAESGRRLTWLAEVDGRPVGMVNLAVFTRMPQPGRSTSRWGYLGNAFVLAAHRDHGIGRLLLDALLAHADREGYVRVVLSPSPRSVPFYDRAGFGPADVLRVRTIDG
jgi:GNAT superfamily N-acetyltransferase